MKLTKMAYENWERREIYEFFKGTTMYTTMHLDITQFLLKIKAWNIRFYPAMIHCIATVINNNSDYRYGYDAEKNIGIWDVLHPMYTVPRKDNPQLFSMAFTEYSDDFKTFYESFLEDYKGAEACNRLHYNTDGIENVMGVTAMSGLHFSSFGFGTEIKPDLTPFTILGKYEKKDGKVLLPLCGEFAHSVNDGYHISHFFSEVESIMNSFTS